MRLSTTIIMSIFMSETTANEKWIAFVTESHNYLTKHQEILSDEYKLGEHERWDWDQETGSLIFSNDGVKAVIAKVQFVGSISTSSDTWLWSWANDTILDKVKDKIHIVREYGKENGFDALTIDKWKADEVDGWEMTSITAQLLNAKGAYRTPDKNGFTYMVITDIAWANN